MLPTISWCLFCSGIAKKNPFLFAFITPIALVLVDKLFLNGTISDTLVINRVTNYDHFSALPLLLGLGLSAAFISLAIIKRRQRI
jgi:hypothetical protein